LRDSVFFLAIPSLNQNPKAKYTENVSQ